MTLLKVSFRLLVATMILASLHEYTGCDIPDLALKPDHKAATSPSVSKEEIEFSEVATALLQNSIARLGVMRQVEQQVGSGSLSRTLPRLRQQIRGVLSANENDVRVLRTSPRAIGTRQKTTLRQMLQAEAKLAASYLEYLLALEAGNQRQLQNLERRMTVNLALYQEACVAVLHHYGTQIQPTLATDS